MTVAKLLVACAVVATLGGCASGVKREGGPDAKPIKLSDTKVSGVRVYLNDAAQKLHSDNIKFNPDALRATLQRTLEARQLVAADAKQRMEVEITDMRVRSTFSSVAFGFMAGADNVTGNVYILDANTRPLSKFEVSTSYALGGIGGGTDEARMSWLYEEFSKRTINELLGVEEK